MLKICTVYFKGTYTPDYVANFYDGLKRNSTIPFQSILMSSKRRFHNESMTVIDAYIGK